MATEPEPTEAVVSEDVPEGWASVRFGEIAQPSTERVDPSDVPKAAYLSLEHIESNTSRIVGRARGSDVTSTKAVFRTGDVLYGKLRPYLNKVCIADFGGICSTDILVFRETPRADNRYLMRLLTTPEVVEYANHHSAGVQLPRISFEKLAQLRVPLPPLAEQKRIVAKVEELLAGVNAARQRLARVPAILKRFRQSVLAAACSGRLTEEWRDRHPKLKPALVPEPKGQRERRGRRGANLSREQDLLVDEEMADLPESWAYARADHLVAAGTVITYGIVLPGPEIPRGVPYVRQQDIEDGVVRVDGLRHTTPEIARKHERSSLKEGDVLLCIIRNLRVAIVPRALDGANLTQGTVRIRPNCNVVFGAYLAAYLTSSHAQGWMKRRYFGMDMPRINVEDARAIPVALPHLDEQREIVRRVEALFGIADAIEKRVAAATTRADKLTQAILAKAFRGELVPTEAELARRESRDFEPASALLERIRVERLRPSDSPRPKRARRSRFG